MLYRKWDCCREHLSPSPFLRHSLPNYWADLFAPLFNLKFQAQSWWKQWLSPKYEPGWGIELPLLTHRRERNCSKDAGRLQDMEKQANAFFSINWPWGVFSTSSFLLLISFSVTCGWVCMSPLASVNTMHFFCCLTTLNGAFGFSSMVKHTHRHTRTHPSQWLVLSLAAAGLLQLDLSKIFFHVCALKC